MTPASPVMSVVKMRNPTSSSSLNWSREATAACLASSSFVVEDPGPDGSPIEPDTSITSSTRAALRCSAHLSSTSTRTAGSGTSSTACGWAGSTPLAATIGRTDGHLRVAGAEAELQDPLLVLGLQHVVAEQLGRLLLLGAHPRRVEDDQRVVGEQRALGRVDRHQRHLRWAGDFARIQHAVGIAAVVVEQRLLLDRDGRNVRERGAPGVGPVPVVEEGQRRVAVVHHGPLDVAGELLDVGPRQVLAREPLRLAGRGVVLGDGEVQPARREVRVGLAQPERTPLRVAELGPSLGSLASAVTSLKPSGFSG